MGFFGKKKTAEVPIAEEKKISSAGISSTGTTPVATNAVNTPTNRSVRSLPLATEQEDQVLAEKISKKKVPFLAWTLGAIACK